jgi:hypothetical protein
LNVQTLETKYSVHVFPMDLPVRYAASLDEVHIAQVSVDVWDDVLDFDFWSYFDFGCGNAGVLDWALYDH